MYNDYKPKYENKSKMNLTNFGNMHLLFVVTIVLYLRTKLLEVQHLLKFTSENLSKHLAFIIE